MFIVLGYNQVSVMFGIKVVYIVERSSAFWHQNDRIMPWAIALQGFDYRVQIYQSRTV